MKHSIIMSLMARCATCLVASIALVACDAVDEADRLQYVKPEAAQKSILIEDYTGQDCVNCPAATDIIRELQQTYGDDVIVAVAIHSGPLGAHPTDKHPDGLATDLGDRYYAYWNIEYQPMGVIDRRFGPQDKNQWTAMVNWMLKQEQPSKVNILVETAFDDASRTLDIDVDVVGAENDTEGKLQLWLTEDHVIAYQDFPHDEGGMVPNYEHNHVLRDAINGDGEDVRLTEGAVKHFSHTYRVNSAWQADNLAIVAFVYNSTDGVVQVSRHHLSNHNTDEQN